MTVDDKRHVGTILFYTESPDDQQRAHRFEIVQGVLRDEGNGWVYAWKLGRSYRDFTTPDKLQAGCRVTFEIDPKEPWCATGLSYRGVSESRP